MLEELGLFDPQIVVEEVKELALHQVGLGLGEEGGVACPVLVLWRRVVEVFCGDDEGREEDTVASARHALGCGRQACPEALEVDQGAQQGGYLHVALLDENGDEGLEGRKGRVDWRDSVGEGGLGGCRGWRRERGGRWRSTLDDVDRLCCDVSNHVGSDR